MGRMMRHKEVLEMIKEHRPGVVVTGMYTGRDKPISFICECGNPTQNVLHQLIKSKSCKKCKDALHLAVEYEDEILHFYSLGEFGEFFEPLIFLSKTTIKCMASGRKDEQLLKHGIKILERSYNGSHQSREEECISNNKLYFSAIRMLSRINNENNPDYDKYGGAGLTIFSKDIKEIVEYLETLPNYQKGNHIDRIDKSIGYEKGNIRWLTAKEKMNNRYNTIMMTLNGETLPLTEWATKLNLNVYTLRSRKKAGWTDEEALTTPKSKTKGRKKAIMLTYKGKTLPLAEWARKCNINEYTVRSRHRLGWTAEQILETPIRSC